MFLHLFDEDGGKVHVGGVTVPANFPIPDPGTVAEIRYLYAFPEGGLHQPVYLGPRTDIRPEECLASQRSFVAPRAAAEVEEEPEAAFAP